VPSLTLLAIALALFVLLLAPTRRLSASGWPPRALGGYLLGMLIIGLAAIFSPISTRLLVPILVVGYLAPFVTARTGLDRLRRGRRPGVTVERAPIKTVSGPARDVPTRAAQPDADARDDTGDEATTNPTKSDKPDDSSGPDRHHNA
jgi:hypothetical protein